MMYFPRWIEMVNPYVKSATVAATRHALNATREEKKKMTFSQNVKK
jgi:hypothetical protein